MLDWIPLGLLAIYAALIALDLGTHPSSPMGCITPRVYSGN